VALARLEVEELAGTCVDGLVGCVDAHAALDDDEHTGLPYLMLAESLTWPQLDENDALRAVAGVEDDRRPFPVRSLDLAELPVVHAGAVPRPESVVTLDH
jgi:hypothetical protein